MARYEPIEVKVDVPTVKGDGYEPVLLHLLPMAKVPVKVLLAHRFDREQQMWDILLWGLHDDAENLEAFGRLEGDIVEDVLARWQQGGGEVSVGESTASSTSSTSSGRRSKPTSSPPASD